MFKTILIVAATAILTGRVVYPAHPAYYRAPGIVY